MSDDHNDHEAGIRTPKQLIAAIAAAFIIPIACIVLLVQYVTNAHNGGAGSTAQSNDAVVARIKPVGDIGFTLKDVNAPRVLQTGVQVFTAVCSACHATGAAGAPKLGDVAAWSPRLQQGYDTLVAHAIAGIRAMPAKGGNPDLDDVEVARAVAYMGNQAGAKFTEPEPKAVPAVATAAGAPGAAGAAPAAADAAATPAAAAAATPAAAAAPAGAAAAPAGAAPAAASAPAAAATPGTATPAAAPEAATPASAAAAPAQASVDAGKKLYEGVCQACHAAGVAGAPKFGDKLAWADRLKQGAPVLYSHAINGFHGKVGVMPPKGGSAASDDEVKAAVDYMSAAAK